MGEDGDAAWAADGDGWALNSRPGLTFVDTAAGPVRVRRHGEGTVPLVMLADGPNTVEHYDRTLDALDAAGAGVRSVVVEPPGTGFSVPDPGFAFTVDAYAGVLAEALDALDISGAIIAAGCAQVYMALALVRRRPDLAARLILMQAPGWDAELEWTQREIDPKGMLRVPGDGQRAYDAERERAVAWWYDACTAPDPGAAYFKDRVHDVLSHGGCHDLPSLVQGMERSAAPEPLSMPHAALVIWGLADATHRETPRETIAELVPGAHIEEWPEAGHFPEIEQAERFAATVREAAAGL